MAPCGSTSPPNGSVERRSAGDWAPEPVGDEDRASWTAEIDFIAAIRGDRPVTLTDFATGAHYMAVVEAVDRSAARGGARRSIQASERSLVLKVLEFARSTMTFRIDLDLMHPRTLSHQPPFALNNARIQIRLRLPDHRAA